MTKRRKTSEKPVRKQAKSAKEAPAANGAGPKPKKILAASVAETARRETAPRKQPHSREEEEPRKEAAPRKQVEPRKEARPRKDAEPRTATFVLPKPRPMPPTRRRGALPVSAASEVPAALAASSASATPVAFATETWGRSVQAAGRGAVAINCALLEIARANLSSGFELAKSLTEARSPLQAARLQLAFWDAGLKAFADQALALQAGCAALVSGANAPLRAHLRARRNSKAA